MTAPQTEPFLVCGLPKTGTTFLQRLLDLHPQISCPSEQSLASLRDLIRPFLEHYAGVLKMVDRRTGGQGASRYGTTIENDMLRSTVTTLSKSFARGRPIHGLNDNDVFQLLDFYGNLFAGSKIIGILRNPVDHGLSIWRHSRRLAREEPSMAKEHLSLLANPKNSVEGYIESAYPGLRMAADLFLDRAEKRGNVLVVLYEQLVTDKRKQITRIVEFLGGQLDDAILSRMTELSSREAMASTSKNPGFFGLDKGDPDRAEVSREFRSAILEAAISPRMRAAGYDVSTLMLGH